MWSTIPLLGVNPKKVKILIKKDICSPMFIGALFTRAKIWKQPKCPSVNQWRKMRWCVCVCVCVCTMEYYSAINKVCSNMDRRGRHYAEWNRLEKDGHWCYHIYVESKKWSNIKNNIWPTAFHFLIWTWGENWTLYKYQLADNYLNILYTCSFLFACLLFELMR